MRTMLQSLRASGEASIDIGRRSLANRNSAGLWFNEVIDVDELHGGVQRVTESSVSSSFIECTNMEKERIVVD